MNKTQCRQPTEFTFALTDVRFAAQNWRRLALQNEPTVSISTNRLNIGGRQLPPAPPYLTPLATPLSGCVPKAAYQYGFLIQRLSMGNCNSMCILAENTGFWRKIYEVWNKHDHNILFFNLFPFCSSLLGCAGLAGSEELSEKWSSLVSHAQSHLMFIVC